MSNANNKKGVVKFLISEWKKPDYSAQLSGKTFQVTEENLCWKSTEGGSEVVQQLEFSHEEADIIYPPTRAYQRTRRRVH